MLALEVDALNTSGHLASPEGEVGFGPVSVIDEARMAEGEKTNSDEDHGSFKDHESDLVVCEIPVKTLVELGNAIYASHEDEDSGEW